MLRFTSCQAETAEPFCEALTQYLTDELGKACEHIASIPWQERQSRLFSGDIQVGWICGLAYVREHDRGQGNIVPLAAPVRSHPRYAGQPVYFSDLRVHAETPYRSLSDLRGKICAYNEPASHSGCNIIRYRLAKEGLHEDFFGSVVQSGSHRNSIRMLLERSIDVAAIDSSVLELEAAANPAIARLRTIEVLGPSPAPPWVIHSSVPAPVRQSLERAMLSMDQHPRGRDILAVGRLLRFAAAGDADYDPIREMDRVAATARFSLV